MKKRGSNEEWSDEALRMEYERGRHDMREEMMQDAVNANIYGTTSYDWRFAIFSVPFSKVGDISHGDKVKLIIIKEEQQ